MSVSTLRVSKQHMIKMATCAIFYCFCCCVNHSSTQFRKVRTLLVIKSTCSVHARAEIMLAPLKIFYRRKTRSNLVLHFFFWNEKFNWTPFNLFGMMAITTTHENVFFQHSILKWNIVCNKVKYHEAFEKAFFSKSVLAYIEMRDTRNR